jgi:hypothetical protein
MNASADGKLSAMSVNGCQREQWWRTRYWHSKHEWVRCGTTGARSRAVLSASAITRPIALTACSRRLGASRQMPRHGQP